MKTPLIFCSMLVGALAVAAPLDKIHYVRTGGEPGSPMETTEILDENGHCSMRFTSLDDRRRPTKDRTLPIDCKVVKPALEASHALRHFTPKEQKGTVYDWGDAVLRLEWKESARAPMQSRETKWVKPLTNQSEIDPLMTRLDALAREYDHETAADPSFAKSLEKYQRLVALVTPGKPGAPTETIEVSRQTNGCRLGVDRTSYDKKSIGHAVANLSTKDCDSVWKEVLSLGLEHLTMEETTGQVSDFGGRSLRIEWKPKPAGATEAHELQWGRPLRDEAKLLPLLKQLSALVRQHASQVPLFYFPAS